MNKKVEVKNYAGFVPVDNGEKRYKIITDDSGNEIGIEVKGVVTTFNVVNKNGQKWEKGSYDEMIASYFEANELNIPLDLMHERTVKDLAGIATMMKKKGASIEIVGFIPKGVYYYGLIKTLIDNGVLQGFSNYGRISDWGYDEDNKAIIVRKFQLVSVSLVDVPSDVGAKLEGNATRFEGFEIEQGDETLKIY